MKKSAAPPNGPPTSSTLPTLKRAVRRSRRSSTALLPQGPVASEIETALHDVLQNLIQEEAERMTRRVYARLPHAIAQALATARPVTRLAVD